MDGPLVSVVITSFNYARFLRTTIDSVIAQEYPRIEIIVVDDGSTDESPSIIRSYGDRVKAILKPNGGQGSACNLGFAASRGDLVLFLDSDDWYYPHAVARVVEAARSGAVLIQFRLDVVDEAGTRVGQIPPPRVRLDSGDVVPQLLSFGHFVGTVTSGNAFRRDALERVLPLPESIFTASPDGYLINTIPFLGRVEAITEPLGSFRLHGSNRHEVRAGKRIDMARVRNRVEWTARELDLVRRQAENRGIVAPKALAMRYMGHLQWRLISCKLEPENHSYHEDVAWKLGFRGALAALRDPGLRPRDRAFMAAWFSMVSLAPRRAARALVELRPGA